jgi:glycosyltransferase involved in cell wall biosynthesis
VRILIFTQYFTPEIGATQTRLHVFAEGLAGRGHDVEVVCEVPNHPQGIVRPGYGGRLVDRRRLDGFLATYVWVRTSPTKTTRTRLAFYGSYMGMAAVVGGLTRRPDVVFASSPPLPVAVAAALAAARHRVPWVMDVRDLWPEAAVAVGELSNRRLLRAAERLECWLYERAAAITTVTEPFRTSIAAKVAASDKIHLVPNGTTSLYLDGAQLKPDRGLLDLPADKFLWTYAGNVGVAQGLETALDAAGILGEGFKLLILGDGPLRPQLEQRALALKGAPVIFRGQVPPTEAIRYLRASDALLVPLADHPALRSFIPSKLYDFCAVKRPVILCATGEAKRLVEDAEAALSVPPGDPVDLAAAVRRISSDSSLRSRLESAGHRFGRATVRNVDALESVLDAVVEGRSPAAATQPTGSVGSSRGWHSERT